MLSIISTTFLSTGRRAIACCKGWQKCEAGCVPPAIIQASKDIQQTGLHKLFAQWPTRLHLINRYRLAVPQIPSGKSAKIKMLSHMAVRDVNERLRMGRHLQ